MASLPCGSLVAVPCALAEAIPAGGKAGRTTQSVTLAVAWPRGFAEPLRAVRKRLNPPARCPGADCASPSVKNLSKAVDRAA